MSNRELIARNVVETLKNQQSVRFGTVTRDPGIAIQDLAQTAFPAVIVESGNETRLDITTRGPTATRQSIMEVNISVWTNSTNSVDSFRNDLVAGIEDLLESDRSRGGNAIDTQLVSVTTNNQETAPYFSMELVFEIQYFYTKG